MRQLRITKQLTNREVSSLDKYLYEIAKIRMLSLDEEVILAQKIRNGDKKAIQTLTSANLRFVVSVSKQYQNQGLSLSDLINEGNIGLMKAAERFDETRGFKFISYAVWWIRQSILSAIAEQSRIIRIPLNKLGVVSKINKTYHELEQEFERSPGIEEIAQCLDLPTEEIRDAYQYSNRYLSMDAPLLSDEESSLYDLLASDTKNLPERKLMKESLQLEIERTIATLNDKERKILKMFFGLHGEPQRSLDEIGCLLNITRERVRQIKERSIKRLRQSSISQILRTYLE